MSLVHPLLTACGVRHAFGTRGTLEPPGLRRPRQVHGARVTDAAACTRTPAPEADAVVSRLADVAVGVVTADCVPLLVAAHDGRAVAAIHAGWRGLAAGVIAAGVRALTGRALTGQTLTGQAFTGRALAGREGDATPAHPPSRLPPSRTGWVAAIGPHAGPCCYEVDAPVLDALRERDVPGLREAAREARPGHWWLDLGALAEGQLRAAGVALVGRVTPGCTVCDTERFESHRRDGPRAGRLVHWIAARRAGVP